MRKALEKFLLKRWYSDKPIGYLKPFACLFSKISLSRRQAFLVGKKQSYKASVPVIVVGNITVGGTGKTPIVIFLAEEMKKRGRKPAVISRGYGAHVESNQMVTELSTYHEVGDEPKLIQQRTGIPVAVGRDRKQSIELILKKYPEIDMIISDDGLQHYALHRDLEIVLIDGDRGLGNSALLPAGPLRESKNRLNEVDFVLINGRSEFNFSSKSLSFKLTGETLKNIHTSEARDLSSFSEHDVYAFAGIGNPERFFKLLSQYGIEVESHFLGDHAEMPDSFFYERLDKAILMTEKDALKYQHLSLSNLWYLPVDVAMQDDAKLHFIDDILNKIS